ncbi:MAG: ABC transporter permease [Nitrososphaerales archaeon]
MGYLRNRIITYALVWFVVVNLAFVIPRLAPGTPAEVLANNGRLPAQTVILLTHRFGLDKPLLTQYILYLKNIFLVFPPNFGYSFQYFPQTATGMFFSRLPATLLLMAVSFILAFFISYIATALSSTRRGGKFEGGALYSSILFHSTPAFWTSMVLLWIFAVFVHFFPLYGLVSPTATGFAYVTSLLWHLVLPTTALTITLFGQIYLLLRGSTQQVLGSDYVKAAVGRGLRDRIVATKYILRNSLLPVVSLFSFSFGELISIIILIESVFGYAGVGDLFVDAVFNRDYPVLEAGFFYATTIVIIMGLFGDILLARLDPRVK